MSSRMLASLLIAGCAAGGAYVAVRQNHAAPPPAASIPAAAEPVAPPVAETEALVDQTPAAEAEPERKPSVRATPGQPRSEAPRPRTQLPTTGPARPSPAIEAAPRRSPANSPVRAPAAAASTQPVSPATQPVERRVAESTGAGFEPEAVHAPEPLPASREPQFEEMVIPASSVIGLQVETALSSERTHLEERVDARVARDVTAGGRVAIPAGSRVIGSVTLVERGGKVKERARLGVRFHTLVLGDGRQLPLRTEAIVREGDSPTNESARKIGGAAIGGAILGAIMGGGKGAVLGGAAGAAGGTAVVMNSDRNAATLPAGTVVTVRLAAPATIDVERVPQ